MGEEVTISFDIDAREYNGRWFVFGDAERLLVDEHDEEVRETFKVYNVPLDRIVGDVSMIDNVEYLPAEKGIYQRFFNDIIGVTHEKGAKVEQVVIRTKTEYQHGLLQTKPLHHSQKETLPFGRYEDGEYGEVTLTIEPNRELRGKILAYGQYLEVIHPQSLREQLKDIIKQQMMQYSDEKYKKKTNFMHII